MITKTHSNALLQQLYQSSIQDIEEECSAFNTEYGYGKGMFISINNYKQTWEQLVRQFRDQYVSIVKSITGKSIHRGQVVLSERRQPKNLLHIVSKKKLVVVACIHDYHPNDFLGRGKSSLQEYKHTHFYVYGAHNYLSSGLGLDHLKDQEEKLKKYLACRYTNRKRRQLWRDNVVSVKPVGIGEYRDRDKVTANTLNCYLVDKDSDSVINYMRNNRHNPEIQYPLYFLYEKDHYEPTTRHIQTQQQYRYYG